MTLEVSDGTTTDTRSFTVTVANTNDAPVITSGPTPVVPENRTSVTTVTASDADAGTTLSYSLAGGADRAAFAIDPSTGVLTFVATPDHETQAGYELEVSVSDGTLTATQRLSVTVSDVDEPPLARSDTLATDEDTVRPIDVTAELLANDVDPEAGPLRLVEVGVPARGVLVSGPDGALEYRPGPDYHGSDEFEYTVEDAAGARSTARVTIEVVPVNDPPVLASTDPTPRPGVIDAAALATGPTSLAENAGTVMRVEVLDVDGDSVSFGLGGADAARFEIDPVSGALRPAKPLDFEVPADADGDNRYELELVLTDRSGGTSRVALTIVAGDVNEAPMIGDMVLSVTADRTGPIGRLQGSDADRGDRLVFERLGGADGSGGLSVGADGRLHADALAVGVHEFEVRVVDAAGLSEVGRVTVTVVPAPGPVASGEGEPSLGEAADESPTAPIRTFEPMPEGIGETIEGPARSEPATGPASASDSRPPVRDTGPGSPHGWTFAATAVPDTRVGSFVDRQFDASETATYEAAMPRGVPNETGSEESREALERGTFPAPSVLAAPEVALPLPAQLYEAIERMGRELDEREAGLEARAHAVNIVVVAGGVTLSVGAAAWLVQSRLLLAAALAAMPLWRGFDPVPILIGGATRRDEDREDEHDEPLT